MLDVAGTITEAGSGTHAFLAGIKVDLSITAGAANTTDVYGIRVSSITAASGTTNATGVSVDAPTGASNNYAINVTSGDIHKAGTAYTNPDYVLEQWATGLIVQHAGREGADRYQGLRPLLDVERFARLNYALPLVDALREIENVGLFNGGDAVLASLEEAYLYLFDHEHRIQALEDEVRSLRAVKGT
jgi:hypothetical protein